MDFVGDALFNEDLVLLGEDGAPFFDPSKPVAFFSQGAIWPNNHIHVLRPTLIGTGRFITYALNGVDYSLFVDGSTRDKLTQGAMNSIGLGWPTLAEQTGIATFLDRETETIDTLIAEQERLVELLQEKRQAVISYAITKGLNPDAPMKASGIDWLGDVPAHWRLTRVKHGRSNKAGARSASRSRPTGPLSGVWSKSAASMVGHSIQARTNFCHQILNPSPVSL
jgi:type I restriction enzyme, S subunit